MFNFNKHLNIKIEVFFFKTKIINLLDTHKNQSYNMNSKLFMLLFV